LLVFRSPSHGRFPQCTGEEQESMERLEQSFPFIKRSWILTSRTEIERPVAHENFDGSAARKDGVLRIVFGAIQACVRWP
jgi:hypothetical protein